MSDNWRKTISEHLDTLAKAGMLREVRPYKNDSGSLNLTDNDYLGLAGDLELREQFLNSEARLHAPSASASALLMGKSAAHEKLEELLCNLYGRPVTLFHSGWQANTGFITALASVFKSRLLILADRLIHASMIDGMRMASLSGAVVRRWRHNDTAHLQAILENEAAHYEAVLVLTESVFSMDGDRSPLAELQCLKAQYDNVILAVDEAHAFACMGPDGRGLCTARGVLADVDILMGTLGKAAASAGAFVAASKELTALFVNAARPLIYSTAESPLQAAWSSFVIDRLPMFEERRKRLANIASSVQERVAALFSHPLNKVSSSHIVPIVFDDLDTAQSARLALKDSGISVSLIRPPTVPANAPRLRLSLKATLTDDDVDRLVEVLERFSRGRHAH